MSVLAHDETVVAEWRDTAGPDNPAGPLFAADEYAEAELTQVTAVGRRCGTDWSNSIVTTRRYYCC